ncbi:hypothetical protein ACJJTC_010107 [Scirpophaga incertulas]
MAQIKPTFDLETEYSPSRWSCRFDTPREVLQYHEKLVSDASQLAIIRIPNKLEIEYGPSPGQKLDILGTDLPDNAPILVYIHGGYWQALSREISRYPAQPLYHANVKTMVLGYDLCPAVTLVEIIEQIQTATKFVFDYASKMGSKGVYFAGHSAGAHLIAKLLANGDFIESLPGKELLQGAFLISGVYDLRDLVRTSVNQALQLPDEWAVSLSPMFDDYKKLYRRNMRIYIIAGENDSPTFKKQSREFYEHLLKVSRTKNMYLEIKDGMDHFNIVECFAEERNYLRSLLLHDIGRYL